MVFEVLRAWDHPRRQISMGERMEDDLRYAPLAQFWGQLHYTNTLTCIKSLRRPNSDVSVAHDGNLIMHMVNLAHRVGRMALRCDGRAGRFGGAAAIHLAKGLARSS